MWGGVRVLPLTPHPPLSPFISFSLISPSTLASCTPWLAHTHEKHVTPEFGRRVYPSGLLYIIYSDLEHFRRAFSPFPLVGATCQGCSGHVVTTLSFLGPIPILDTFSNLPAKEEQEGQQFFSKKSSKNPSCIIPVCNVKHTKPGSI